MKVSEALKEKEILENIFKNLEKLEIVFKNDEELDEEIADKADINMSVYRTISEAKMRVNDDIRTLDNRISNAELPE